jgi:hypothetical protein
MDAAELTLGRQKRKWRRVCWVKEEEKGWLEERERESYIVVELRGWQADVM